MENTFRGQRIYSDEWVYGYYVFRGGIKHQIVSEEYTFPFQVKPETVGRFIGLKDKHGKKCFEGEIVEYYTNVRKTRVIAEIKWEQQACAYWLKWVEADEGGKIINRYRESTATFSDGETYQCDYINIIGNIHETPNLLKQK